MSASAYEKVKLARDNDRPTGFEYIKNIITGFVELHGDRRYGDDAAIIGGIGFLDEKAVTVIAIEKGKTAKERVKRSFGAPEPEGYRKALRLMKQAEKFKRPVVCFVDTSGAYCGVGAEERGQGEAIAENLMEMSALKTPIISIVIGEGGSGGALALAVADRVWMLENSIYSVISPEGCASILWRDSSLAESAAECLKLTAQDGVNEGIVDDIITEESLGQPPYYKKIKDKLSAELDVLMAKPEDELLAERYEKFRKIGRD